MASPYRIKRLNSLLKEVISEVIRNDVRNPKVSKFTTTTKVEITPDLSQAKVYISVLGDEKEKESTLKALQSAKVFIGMVASKKIVIRHFPVLTFIIDNSVEDLLRIEKILKEIEEKKSPKNARKKTK